MAHSPELLAQVEKRMIILNSLTRDVNTMFPGLGGSDTKHTNFYKDYGYPLTLGFSNYFDMWDRNGIAAAGVNKPVDKCWQDFPQLVEKEDTHDITSIEGQLAELLEDIQFWSQLSEADKMSRVGEYSGVIFRFRDSQPMNQPVTATKLGLQGIAEIIPAWQGQLTASEIEQDEKSENYGKPKMYAYKESDVAVSSNSKSPSPRQFDVHPDRVHIWSRNHSIYGNTPILKAGFNDLITIQKVIGAGGEGFWKNAKAAPILNIEKDMQLDRLAASLNVPLTGLADKLDEIIADYQTGLDKMLMLQGIEAKPQSITLGDPEKPFLVACQSFAASVGIPMKILIGSQTGERASTEDSKEFSVTCNSRRTNYVRPNIMRIVKDKLVKFGVIPAGKWYLLWSDLTESSTDEKFALVDKMAGANQKMAAIGPVFTDDEMREVVGYKALTAAQIPKRAPADKTSQTTD